MTTILTDNQHYANIASAIRGKNGLLDTYTPSEMAAAIAAIPTGGSASLGSKSITANGTYNASADSLDGYNEVTVNVSGGGGGVEFLTPTASDFNGGYCTSANYAFDPSGDGSTCRNDMYYLDGGYTYIVGLDGTVGNRFRCLYTSTPTNEATGTISGTGAPITENNPSAYQAIVINPSTDTYLTITKTTQSTNGLKTYVAKWLDIVNAQGGGSGFTHGYATSSIGSAFETITTAAVELTE